MEEEEGDVVLSRPISRVYCRQRYDLRLKERSTTIGVDVTISIIEEGRGSRKGCLKTHVFISGQERERQAILDFLKKSGISEKDGDFMITSLCCFYTEIILLKCWTGGLLTLHMNVLVNVDHYQKIHRGIKIDQDFRIIKADQQDGVWDLNSIIVDHDESWDHHVFFDINQDNNSLRYTFPRTIRLHDHAMFKIPFKPASASAIKSLRITSIEEKIGCTICLEDLLVGVKAYTLPCGHHFHTECISNWLKTSHYCPMCRFALPAQH